MSAATTDESADISLRMATVQDAAGRLIAKLCDRSAYVSDDEYQDILNLVRALRAFCAIKV